MNDIPSILLTYPEAATLLGVSPRTVWNLTNAGELPVVRLARRVVRIDRRDIEALIERAKNKACDLGGVQ
jgi:excisionase family DNA binding protein